MASPGTSILSDLIFNKRWEDVELRIRTEDGKAELRRRDALGHLPLHFACCWGASFEAVEAMLLEYPEAAELTDKLHEVPLHYAFACGGSGGSPRVVRLLLGTYPEGAKVVDNGGKLPLHLACEFENPFESVEAILQVHPEAVKVADKTGHLPLYWACCNDEGVSPPVVQLLLGAYPEGARTPNESGDLPLHGAVSGHAPSDVLRILLDAYPEGAATRNIDGYFPIQLMVKLMSGGNEVTVQESDYEADVIEELIRPILNNEVVFTAHHAMILLHMALEFGLSIDMMRSLLANFPEGVRTADDDDCLPLHLTAKGNASLEVLNLLIDAHPEGAATGDGDGLFPLHCLVDNGSPENKEDVEKIKALLRPILDNEEACLSTTDFYYDEEKTPLDIASEFDALSLLTCVGIEKCPANVIMKVARLHPEQVRARDSDGNYPLHFVAANPNLNGAKVLSRGLLHGSSGHDEGDEAGDEATGDEGSVEHDDSSVDSLFLAMHDAEIEKYLTCVLVEMYPEAASAWNAESRFPLNLAIESGKRWHEGVEAITDAAKHVILSRDEATDLYPFMLAAACDNSCLDTVYSLLRRCPELKRYMFD